MDLADKFEHAQRAYGSKVRTFARNARGRIRGYDQNDLEQEMLIELWWSVVHYDPNKGASFNTFFQRNAKNRIITLIRHGSTQSRSAVTNSLTDETIQAQVDDMVSVLDAESIAIMQMEIKELVAEYGDEVFEGKQARQLKRALAEAAA